MLKSIESIGQTSNGVKRSDCTYQEIREQFFKRDALNDVQRIDDVAETLGHLTTGLIAHHRMQQDLLERYLAR